MKYTVMYGLTLIVICGFFAVLGWMVFELNTSGTQVQVSQGVDGQVDLDYSLEVNDLQDEVGMVQPVGNDPDLDEQYADINKTNSQANVNQSKAYQRRGSVWIIWVIVGIFAYLGIVLGTRLNNVLR